MQRRRVAGDKQPVPDVTHALRRNLGLGCALTVTLMGGYEMIDRKFIGLESEERFADVEKGQLRLFAKATGETNPIFFDEAAAKAAGYPAIAAPPTFAFCLASLAPPAKGSLRDMDVPIEKVLHGEQHFTYHKQIFAGDRIRIKSKVVDIYDKKGGALEFVVTEITSHNQNGELCVSARNIAVVRN